MNRTSFRSLLATFLTLHVTAALPQSPAATNPPGVPQPALPLAQTTAPTPGIAPAQPAPDAVNRANTELVVTLLRTTMVAVHQANFSGNYSVLRDIGAPDFHAKNSAADLAHVFRSLRELKVDLGAVVLLDPQIRRAELTADKKLYIVGALATKPVPVTFEMLFQPVAGVWRVYGISITPVEALANAPAPAALVQPQPARAAARPQSAAIKKPAVQVRNQEQQPTVLAPNLSKDR